MRPQSPANFLHVLRNLSLLSQRSFLSPLFVLATRDYAGRAAILSQARPGALLAPSHKPPISSVTYSSALPPQPLLDADEVGFSPVNAAGHFVQVIPPVTLMVRGP